MLTTESRLVRDFLLHVSDPGNRAHKPPPMPVFHSPVAASVRASPST